MDKEYDTAEFRVSSLRKSVSSLLALIDAYETVSPPSAGFIRKWEGKTIAAATQAVHSKTMNPADRKRLSFFLARRYAMLAQGEVSTELSVSQTRSLKTSCVMLTEGYMLVSKGPANQRMTEERYAGLEAAIAVDKVTANVMSAETRRFSRRLQAKWLADNPVGQEGESKGTGEEPNDVFLQIIGIGRTDFYSHLQVIAEFFTQENARPTPNVMKKPVTLPTPPAKKAGGRVRATSKKKTSSPVSSPAIVSPQAELPLRIQSVTLTAFRGAVRKTRLDFGPGRKGNAHLIMGDAGVGKTSIVHALEFALQDRVGKKPVIENRDIPTGVLSTVADIRNRGSHALPTVEVELSDGEKITRSLVQLVSDDDGTACYRSHGPLVRPDFRVIPLALTQADITSFLREPSERENVFLDYFLSEEENETLLSAWHEYVEAEKQLQEIVAELAMKMNLLEENTQNGTWIEQITVKLQENKATMKLAKAQRKTGTVPVNTPAEIRFLLHHDEWRKKYQAAKKEYLRARSLSREDHLAGRTERHHTIQTRLHGIGDELTTAFAMVAQLPHVEKIEVTAQQYAALEEDGSKEEPQRLLVEVVVHLANGRTGPLETVLSERYSEIVTLLLLLLTVKRAAEAGNTARILVLDDVFSSMDSGLRKNLADWLISQMNTWQLIVTVHDRLWLMQLRQALRSAGMSVNEHELRRWDFTAGIQLKEEVSTGRSSLLTLIESGDPMLIAAGAGRLLEQASSELSWRLRTKIERRRDDKYSLGDLWPPVKTALTSFRNQRMDTVCSAVDSTYYLRNQLGAHHNEWTDSFSLEEAVGFGKNVLAFYDMVYCSDCSSWIEKNSQGRTHCLCKTLTY